ncbi:hypothetical protein [Rummeliibacillus sp. POC4]|uniref:hypothetical protein n=1 Tax=Rummeliibacillus sp. POC4 TaxID=2305899 RepID=UPI000E66D9D7|nr:hypothetical protein [Rummeliibacillus sp. POC4]RIJ66189.1 hypothetical protein D1606_06615 [Rummeliibacillus sp. POC4]
MMKINKITIFGLLVSIFLIVAGIFLFSRENKQQTTVHISHAPTAEEVLKENANTDLFMLEDSVYETNIEWVDQLSLTKKDIVGEIESNYSNEAAFKNKMATKLPIGTKIYSTNEREDVLIVQYKGEERKYYRLSEG